MKKEKTPSQLSSYFENSGLPAAIMGNVKKDGTMEWKAFGPSVWGGSDTINENNIFRIYSMTKAITSVAALQLVEKGLIGLDDPLNSILPEMTAVPILNENGELVKSTQPISLRHLLTHTSGFGYTFFSERLIKYDASDNILDKMRRLSEPGKEFKYGISTDWLGRVVEKISGQNLEAYVRKHISDPLNMSHTWFNVPDELKENIVSYGIKDSVGYNPFPDRIPQKPTDVFYGGQGLFSSAKDYATFLLCLMNNGKYDGGQILKPKTVTELFKNQLPGHVNLKLDAVKGHPWVTDSGDFPVTRDKFSFAFGIEANPNEKVRPQGTAYWAGLANSYYSLDKTNGVAIVYFTQFLPFNDKETYDFYRLYEKEVYAEIEK